MVACKFFIIAVLLACALPSIVHAESCVQCNSADDVKCATHPERYMAKTCATNSSSLCYTRVLNGNTIRGCASDLSNATAAACNNESECLICSFMEGCNRNVFPRHRAQCLQCMGNSTGPCATDVFRKPTVCPLYRLGDKCYIRYNGKNNTDSFQRGCLSTVQQEKKLCMKDNECYTCEGAGCNFLEFNSNDIPRAGAAKLFGCSLALMLLAAIGARFF